MTASTFCFWRQHHGTGWQTGAVNYIGLGDRVDPDGAWQLVGVLADTTPRSYRTFAAKYFGVRQLGDLELAVGEVDRFVDQLSCDLCAVHGALHRAPVCDGVPGRLSTQPWRTA